MDTKFALSDRDSESLGHAHGHGHLAEMLDLLHRLLLTVTSQVWHRRISHRPMGDAKEKHEIWHKLESHIEQMPVEEASPAVPVPRESPPATKPGAGSVVNLSPPTGERGELGEYYAHKRIAHRPHIDETLKASTFEHINIACAIARRGNKSGAKMRIRLAEDAMLTASRFLSDQEYEEFRNKVELHLRSLVGA